MPPPTPKAEHVAVPNTQGKSRNARKRSADRKIKKDAGTKAEQEVERERIGVQTGMQSAPLWTPTEEGDPSLERPEHFRRDPTPDEEIRGLDLNTQTPNPEGVRPWPTRV